MIQFSNDTILPVLIDKRSKLAYFDNKIYELYINFNTSCNVGCDMYRENYLCYVNSAIALEDKIGPGDYKLTYKFFKYRVTGLSLFRKCLIYNGDKLFTYKRKIRNT